MKNGLFLSAIVASLTLSTATFAQNYVAIPSAEGASHQQNARFGTPYGGFSGSDLGYAPMINRGRMNRNVQAREECSAGQERNGRTGSCRPSQR